MKRMLAISFARGNCTSRSICAFFRKMLEEFLKGRESDRVYDTYFNLNG